MAFLRVLVVFLSVIASLQAVPIDNGIPTTIEVENKDYLQFLIYNVIKQSQSDNVCTDFYSNACIESQPEILRNYNFKKNVDNVFSNTMAIFKNILNTTRVESKAFNIEQQLYKNCMNLGDSDEYTESSNEIDFSADILDRFTVKALFNSMLEKIGVEVNESDWRDLENKLVSLGYDHLFFDISVVDDPLEPGKRIVLLEPPALKEWNRKKFTHLALDILVQLEKEAFQYCKKVSKLLAEENTDQSSTETVLESQTISENQTNWFDEFKKHNNTENLVKLCKPFESFPNRRLKTVDNGKLDLVDIFNRIPYGKLSTTNDKEPYKRLTIKSWSKMYDKEVVASGNNISWIDWLQVIQNKFEPLGIFIDEDEPIIVKNEDYFFFFVKYLRWFPTSYMVDPIQLKFVTDNIRYLRWDWAVSLNHVDKSSFCFQETKFYGVSAGVLQFLRDEYLGPYIKKVENVKNNIVNTIYSEIIGNQVLSQQQKIFLNSKLQVMTENTIEGIENMKFFSNYYGRFELTGDYFNDIRNYRTLLKNKNYCSLRNPPLMKYLPFSINDIEQPRNRFILHAILNAIAAKPIFTSSPNKEVYYATYGVNMASYIYTLLRDDKLGNLSNEYLYDRRGSEWLIPYSSYPQRVVNCFIRENIFKYGFKSAYKTITEIIGVQLAHKAMLNDSTDNISKDFYTYYVQTQCDADNKKMTNKVISNLKEFYVTFDCSDIIKSEGCNIAAFDF